MDTLKKIFPLSFKEKKDVAALIINILIQLVVGIIAGALIAILAKIPIIGIIIGIVGALVDVYVVAGIVLAILHYIPCWQIHLLFLLLYLVALFYYL